MYGAEADLRAGWEGLGDLLPSLATPEVRLQTLDACRAPQSGLQHSTGAMRRAALCGSGATLMRSLSRACLPIHWQSRYHARVPTHRPYRTAPQKKVGVHFTDSSNTAVTAALVVGLLDTERKLVPVGDLGACACVGLKWGLRGGWEAGWVLGGASWPVRKRAQSSCISKPPWQHQRLSTAAALSPCAAQWQRCCPPPFNKHTLWASNLPTQTIVH